MSFFDEVYKVIRKVPKGRVVTYGQVARMIGTKNARRVGQALHANRNPEVPCHRVIFANGSLAPGYAFGGLAEQKKRLAAEGVGFVGEKVDMDRFLMSS
ncbi:hypothetical protein A3H89_03390 [Candidatus Amesbacteria bacterium RIFCSPLOWO2_02_FULL_48_11]|nr:MAG: hypothetical protein A2W16_00405 [Candidatus Amesbacteria bacterium RBG_16_48_31]OGD04800.1 MAG: hypothetical protein A3B58_00370 [Candidatus Amesbacteria bacterium RIFCSPLOWO2_01_FULL_48_50]OGD07710.1 MAG: hypothetical protein A3H89_03390 [Candidatus Amesbacteria bacterium RIFCSPLOWO2_02_FULL_48_11]